MKLHLPLQLLAAVLAGLSWTASADSISINFGATQSQTAGKTGTAGLGAAVGAAGWNNAVGQSGSKTDLVNQDGAAIGGSVQWTAPQAPWGPGGTGSWNPSGLLQTIQATYLDLGQNNKWTVNIATDFLLADVYVYLSGDNNKYGAVNVNGTSYVGEAQVNGEGGSRVATADDLANGWGDRSTSASATLEFGKNALVVSGLSGSAINLSNVPSGATARRATLSGVQIVDAAAELAWNRTVSGDTTWDAEPWTNTQGGVAVTKSWADIVADAQARAIAELSGNGTVTLNTAVTAEALIAANGSTITLAGEQLNLNGLATLLAQSGATLTLANSVSAEGAVTISGMGTVLASVDQAWHALSGGGTLELAAGKRLTLDGTVASDFTGHLILNEGSSATLSAENFSNSIRAEGSGTMNLNIDGKGAALAGGGAVWQGNAGTNATATHIATVTNATVNGNLTVVGGTGTFNKVETTLTNTTVTGTLHGTNAALTTGGMTINLGEGNTIDAFKMGTQGTSIVGDVTLNISGGVIGAGNTDNTTKVFALTARDGNVQGNVFFNVSGGTIKATDIAFGGFGRKDGKSLTGNAVMHVTGGAIESNIYTGSTWGGHIGGDFTVLLEGGTMGKDGASRVLSAGACSTSYEETTMSVGGNVAYTLAGGADEYGTSFLGTYAIYGGGLSNSKKVNGTSTITLKDVTKHDTVDTTHGVANFTGVISGGNASGGGVSGAKALVFDNYQTLAQANFKHFDTATVQGTSHVTLTNALNTNITAWTVTGTSELKVTSGAALGGGSVAVDAGSSLIYDPGTSTAADSMTSALSGAGSFVKNGGNTLTLTGASTVGTVAVNAGSLGVGNTMTANALTVGTGARLVLQDGAQLSATSLTNNGTVVVEGGGGLGADSAALSGAVEWTGGTLTLGNTSQYAATTTTLSGNASYMVLALTGDVSAETTVSFALGDLVLNGGLLTFSMTGADTSAFNLGNFTLTTTSITGTASISDSIFLSLNGTVYQGQEATGGSITFTSVGDLPTNGSADGNTNYKLNVSAALAGPTTVNNLFLIPTDQAAGITLTMDAANALTVNGTLTVEGGAGAVNLAGGSATANEVKLTSGNLVLQQDASLTVNRGIVSTGGKIKFDGGTFIYGTGFDGDISSFIADGGDVKVTTSATNVTWATDVLSGHAIEKSGAGRLTLDSVTLTSNVNLNIAEGQLAVNVSSNQTSSITASNKLVLAGSGTLVKTGNGTWQISQAANATQANSDAMSGNTFAGDILVEGGTLRLGKTTTGGIGEKYTVSANALGLRGTIKVGSGAWLELGITQNGTVAFAKNIELAGGSSLHTIDGNYNFTGQVTLSGDATIQVDWGKTANILNLIGGTGKLTVKHTGGTEIGKLKLQAGRYEGFSGTAFSGGIDVVDSRVDVLFTKAEALGSGSVYLATALTYNSSGSIAEGNVLEYQGTGTANDAYDTMNNLVTGNGGLLVSSGRLEMTALNTFKSSTRVTGTASLMVSGSIGSAADSNTFTVAKNASLVVNGTGSIANSGVAVSARSQAATFAADSSDVATGTLKNVTVQTDGIRRTSTGASDRGSIENGTVNVTADAFTIENVDLVNSLVSLQSSGSVTLNNVTIGAGTVVEKGTGSVTLNNSTLVLTSQSVTGTTSLNAETHTLSVTSDALASYTTLSGTLTLDLTKDFIDSLVAGANGHFTTIELTFTGTDAFWDTFKANEGSSLAQTGELNHPMFGPPTVTFGDTAGTVIISAAPANIPEPATAALGLFGLAGLMLRRRRRS